MEELKVLKTIALATILLTIIIAIVSTTSSMVSKAIEEEKLELSAATTEAATTSISSATTASALSESSVTSSQQATTSEPPTTTTTTAESFVHYFGAVNVSVETATVAPVNTEQYPARNIMAAPRPVVEEYSHQTSGEYSLSYDEYMSRSIDEKYSIMVQNGFYGYSKEDYDYLLMAIVGEAGCCSRHHQLAVGSVVLNRYHNNKYFPYGKSVKAICLAPYQYSCFTYGGAYRTPTDTNKDVAMELLRYGSIYPVSVIFQAEFRQGDGVYEELYDPAMRTTTYFCYKK